jgi:phasin family protein
MMSDIKPRRPARAAATTSGTVLDETPPTATPPTTSSEPAASAEAAAQAAAHVTPAKIAEAVEQAEAATADVAQDARTAFAEAQAALARGFELAALEMTGMTHSGMAATADAAVALLSARTLAEAIEINASLARRGVDSMLEGSAKLSEIGTRAVADASRPILSRVSGVWSGLAAG